MYLPDVPCYVIQRGNNWEAWFYSDQFNQFYLDCLEDASHRYGERVHAVERATFWSLGRNQLKVKDYWQEYEELLPDLLDTHGRAFTILSPIRSWGKQGS